MVASVGPLATRSCEPRQIRKEAAAAVDACAGVWLGLATTLIFNSNPKFLCHPQKD